ncbi:hypothetical protein G7054_g9401 [Neopestalotiopsis clavispora]|nr:hypothetical protein G7054_g9401 [Neopestalotiopsis clavispora]
MEVAGLVLGALPLVVTAIESYDTIAKMSSNYWHYHSTLEDIRLQVFAQDQQLRITLKGINLADPTQQNLGTQMRKRFPDDYQQYLSIIRQMDTITAQMMRKLELDSNGKPEWRNDTTDRAGYEWRRVKRSISHMKTWTFAEQLQHWNNVLARCLETSEANPQSSVQTPTLLSVKNAFDIDQCDKTRENVQIMFDAVHNAMKCNDIDHRHQGNLKLLWHETDRPQLDMLPIAMTPGQCQPDSSLIWYSFVVEVHDDEPTAPAAHSRSSASLLTANSPRAKGSKGIGRRFMSALRKKKSTPPKATFVVPPAEKTIVAHQKIESMCSLITGTTSDSQFILGSSESNGYIFIKHEQLDPLREISVEFKSLYSNSKRMDYLRGRTPRASLADRLAMSAGLCWGVLYLAETAWLAPDWDWIEDISVFTKSSNNGSAPQLPAIGWPGSHDKSTSPLGKQPLPTFQTERTINKTLFALGILLIELCLASSFQSLKATSLSQRSANQPVPDDIEIADELVQRVYDSVGLIYGYAAQRCIRGDFPGRRETHKLDRQSFRLDFFNEVVAPVQATYKHFAPLF